jgi:hypothetical protein
MSLYAGAAQVCITPPIGVELAGYGPFRQRRCTSVHDDLYAAALVLQDEQTRVAFVTADLLSLDPAIVDRIRHLAAQETGIPAAHMMISCTHSHTSPTARFLRAWGDRDLEYISLLARQIAGAIIAANNARQPARVGCGLGRHDALAWNRVQHPEDVDTSVQVMRMDAIGADRPLAVVVNYACHPVMLGPIAAISADYPGALRSSIAAAFPGTVVLFANGTCGDIDPVSNRDVWGQATFEDVRQAGSLLAEEALGIARQVQLREHTRLGVRHGAVELPYQHLDTEQVEQELQHRLEEGMRRVPGARPGAAARSEMFWQRWAQDVQAALHAGAARPSEQAELQAVYVGDTALLALPGEIFTALGLTLKAQSAYDQTFIVTYANGNVGYVTTEQDFAEQRYGSSMAFAIYGNFQFQPNVGTYLVEAAAPLVRERF